MVERGVHTSVGKKERKDSSKAKLNMPTTEKMEELNANICYS